MTVVTSVMRTQQLLFSRVDAALKPFGLSFARFEVLRLLAFSRIGRLPPSDRRAALLALTDDGRALVERATTAFNSEVFRRSCENSAATADLVAIVAGLRKNAGDLTGAHPHPYPDPL